MSAPAVTETKSTDGKHVEEKYCAVMLLSGIGDAMGYKHGRWEFDRDGAHIHKELAKITKGLGVAALKLELPDWNLSDDTVMHIATAEGLLAPGSLEDKLNAIAKQYVICFDDMDGRAPGLQTAQSIRQMGDGSKWRSVKFSDRAGGCGAAMRSMCIGLAYHRPEDLKSLIAVAVESGRMTHHLPTGYLGSVAGALFTAYALQGKPIVSWGAQLMATLPAVIEYVQEAKRQVDENVNAFGYFTNHWRQYLEARGIADGKGPVKFPTNYGVVERDKFYHSVAYSGWGGSSGHDAPLIGYDALLGCNGSFEELCLRGVLHGGDSDSTGTMCCAWWGALYGLKGVPAGHYCDLEYRDRLIDLGKKLYAMFGAKPAPASSSSASASTSSDVRRMSIDQSATTTGPSGSSSGSGPGSTIV